jgi:hypothetical protein
MKFSWKSIQKRFGNTYKFNYYKSIDYLPIFNFFKIIETDDKRYLIKLDDYELLPDEVDLDVLNKLWIDIQDEYSKAEDNNSAIIQFTTAKGVCKLEIEYLVLWNIHNLMVAENNGPNTKECLKRAGLEDKNLKWIEKRLKALNNKIKLKRETIKEQAPENKKFDFWRIIDEIEDIKGRAIDITKTTVRQYIAIKQNIKRNGKRQDTKK